jgi:hypothetical protein
MHKILNTLTLALSLKGEGSKFAPPLRGGLLEGVSLYIFSN